MTEHDDLYDFRSFPATSSCIGPTYVLPRNFIQRVSHIEDEPVTREPPDPIVQGMNEVSYAVHKAIQEQRRAIERERNRKWWQT